MSSVNGLLLANISVCLAIGALVVQVDHQICTISKIIG